MVKKRKQPCIFCGDSKTSKEHLWGSWAKELLAADSDETGKGNHSITLFDEAGNPTVGQGHFSNSGHGLSQTTKVVCAMCNNTWMSQIESRMKKNFINIFINRKQIIRPRDQKAIAEWAFLKFVLYQRAYPPQENAIRPNQMSASKAYINQSTDRKRKGEWREFYENRKIPKEYKMYLMRISMRDGGHIFGHNMKYEIYSHDRFLPLESISFWMALGGMAVFITSSPMNTTDFRFNMQKFVDERMAVRLLMAKTTVTLRTGDVIDHQALDHLLRGVSPSASGPHFRSDFD